MPKQRKSQLADYSRFNQKTTRETLAGGFEFLDVCSD